MENGPLSIPMEDSVAGMKENGINNGPFTMWYPDGKVKMRGQYKEGGKDGKSTHLSHERRKMERAVARKGKPVGIWKTWSEAGELIEEVSHEPWKPISRSSKARQNSFALPKTNLPITQYRYGRSLDHRNRLDHEHWK